MKRNVKFIILFVSACLFSQKIMAANPCDPSAGEFCSQISLLDALELEWQKGERAFVVKAKHKLEAEATFSCPSCNVYQNNLGSLLSFFGAEDDGKEYAVCEENYQYEYGENPNDYNGNKPFGDKLGLEFENEGRTWAFTELQLLEQYTFTPDGKGGVNLSLLKTLRNHRMPVGVQFQFKIFEKMANCYERSKRFETMSLLFNEDTSLFENSRAFYDGLGVSAENVTDLGNSESGYFYLPNNPRWEDRPAIEGRKSFAYEYGEKITSKDFAFNFDLDEVSGSRLISDPSYIGKTFRSVANEFLNTGITLTPIPEFWFDVNNRKMYMVFQNDPTGKRVEFKIDINSDNVEQDGDALFFKKKAATAVYALAYFNEYRGYMRDDTFEAKFGNMERSLQKAKDILQKRALAGDQYTEAMTEVKEALRAVYAMRQINVRKQFERDLNSGKSDGVPGVTQKIDQQLEHLFRGYDFDVVESGTPLYSIYGQKIKDSILGMRIPDKLEDVPNNQKVLFKLVRKLHTYANQIVVRSITSDTSSKTVGMAVNLVHYYDLKVKPEIDRLRAKGISWGGNSTEEMEKAVNRIRDLASPKGKGPVKTLKVTL